MLGFFSYFSKFLRTFGVVLLVDVAVVVDADPILILSGVVAITGFAELIFLFSSNYAFRSSTRYLSVFRALSI